MGPGTVDKGQKGELLTAEEIVQEAQQRSAELPTEQQEQSRRATVLRLNRGVFRLANHWVGLFNVLILLYLGGTFLAPVLMHAGAEGTASALYAFYKPFCHQYPFRSWFLYGDTLAHPLREPVSILKMNALSSYVGSADAGYKVALCQRDVAIYGMMAIAGMVYGVVRRFTKVPPMPLWLYFTFGIVPMMLDGGIQWVSYAVWQFLPGLLDQPFETIPALRTLTGALFGFGVIGVGYPYLGEYFDDVRSTLHEKYGW